MVSWDSRGSQEVLRGSNGLLVVLGVPDTESCGDLWGT